MSQKSHRSSTYEINLCFPKSVPLILDENISHKTYKTKNSASTSRN